MFVLLLFIAIFPKNSNAQTTQPWVANWIWTSVQGPENTWLSLRKKVTLDMKPTTAMTRIAAESKYWLYVNEKLVVSDGGIEVHPDLQNTYYDEIDLAPYLQSGENIIAVMVWYKGGVNGYSQRSVGNGGFLFESKIVGTSTTSIVSDNTWKVIENNAFKKGSFNYKFGVSGTIKFNSNTFGDPVPNVIKYGYYRTSGTFGPYIICANENQSYTLNGVCDVAFGTEENQFKPAGDIKWIAWPLSYDARDEIDGWRAYSFNDATWSNAVIKGVPPVSPWNKLIHRTIPFIKDYGLSDYQNQALIPTTIHTNLTITGQLGINIQGSPYLKVDAPAGVRIRMTLNDFYWQEYVTKAGIQEFECYQWQNSSSHKVKYEFSNVTGPVTILGLKFRQTSYNTEVIGCFTSNDSALNTLWTKSKNTSFVCMRDIFYDCPDRERGQWWGDVSQQILYSLYIYDQVSSSLLIKKGFRELMNTQKADGSLYTTAPNDRFHLPDQNMAAVSMIWKYYQYTGDIELVQEIYPQMKKFIQYCVNTSNTDGMLVLQTGNGISNWIDWGDNKDLVDGSANTIFNAIYIVLLEGMKNIAADLNQTSDATYYQNLQTKVKNNFNNYFWNGSAYAFHTKNGVKSAIIDDRTNAWAVLSGMVDEGKKAGVMKVLKTMTNAGPYQEMYIEKAMLQLDPKAALDRMRSRYSEMITNWSSTLWEEFPANNSSSNHAWSAGPLYNLSAIVLGIEPINVAFREFSFLPKLADLKKVAGTVPSPHGNIMASCSINTDNDTLVQELTAPNNTICLIGVPKQAFGISKTIKEVKIGSTRIWQNGVVGEKVSGVQFYQEDKEYILFKVQPGTWTFCSVANESANAGLKAIIAPETQIGLTNAESIKVTVFNENKTAQMNIPISYSINNGNEVNDTISTIPAQSNIDFAFAQKADMSAPGAYTIALKINPLGDTYANDDTLSTSITNFSVNADWALLCTGKEGIKVKIDNANDLNMRTPFTIEAWVYPVVFRSDVWGGTVVSKETGSSGYALTVGGNGQARFVINSAGTWMAADAAAGSIKPNEWQHIAGVFDGTTLKIYVNGVFKSSKKAGIPAISTGPLSIGETAESSWGDRSFNGGIDEVKIWNRALTLTEINDFKDYKRSGEEEDLLVYYRFNEGMKSIVISDLTSNNHDGTMINNNVKTSWMPGKDLPFKEETGILKFENKNFIVFPNPANDVLNLQFSEAYHDLSIRIINLTGSTIYSKNKMTIEKGQTKQINCKNFASGVYLVVVNDVFKKTVIIK